jgi:hypothetical protein
MNSRRILLLFAALLGPFCSSMAFAAITFDITVVNRDGPIVNKRVFITPSEGSSPDSKRTDRNGRVEFQIRECEHVNVWVDLPDAVDLPNMSGRFNHRTSVYVPKGYYGAVEMMRAEHLGRLFEAIQSRYQGENPPPRVVEQLRAQDFRAEINEITQPEEHDDQETRQEKADMRANLLKSVNELIGEGRG